MTKIAIAADHAGRVLKDFLRDNLKDYQIIDLGTDSAGSVDYPDYAAKVCESIKSGNSQIGILVCGSGIGMSIAANKFSGIRAAHVESIYTARLAKEHNDANVLCLGERITGAPHALEMVQTWLAAEFGGAGVDPCVKERHQRRINKIQ